MKRPDLAKGRAHDMDSSEDVTHVSLCAGYGGINA